MAGIEVILNSYYIAITPDNSSIFKTYIRTNKYSALRQFDTLFSRMIE